jgi:hypothetical protein
MIRAILAAVATLVFVSAHSPVRAQEVQVILTGTSCALAGCTTPGGADGSFRVSFDMDTVSELQSYAFVNAQDVECVSSFSASDIAITNFSASVNGRALVGPSALTGSVGMTLNDGPCHPNSYGISIQAGAFAWSQLAGGTAISEAQLQATYDPFESMVLGHYAPEGEDGGAGTLSDWTVRGTMSVTPVGEPATGVLCLAGLCLLWLARRQRVLAPRRTRNG